MKRILFILNWIKKQKKINKIKVIKTNIDAIKSWIYKDREIFHINKNFFSIQPYYFTQKSENKSWMQPIIVQNEIGILGILKKKIDNKDYYLLQAKVEPGNINGIQLSPTVQATKSNYLQKHFGKKTNYIEFFLKNKKNIILISKKKLSEQGTKYLNKSNLNILIDIKKLKLNKKNNFIWLNKEEIKFLLNKRNLINMDTLSVFSSSIKKTNENKIIYNNNKIFTSLNKFTIKKKIKKKKILFSQMKNWIVTKKKIYDIKKNFFSISFFNVNASLREVKNWSQPLLSDYNKSFIGFIVKKINNTYFYLAKLNLEPGHKSAKFTTTILIKNYKFSKYYKSINYYNFFLKKNNLKKYIFSDEGGRFYKNETLNYIKILKNSDKLKVKRNFFWISHNQIIDLMNKDLLSIEARNLFACFNVDKIK